MTDDWRVGDLAVASFPKCQKATPPGHVRESAAGSPRNRSVHRVVGVVIFCGEVGLIIPNYPSLHSTKAWLSDSFRKIRPAEEEFTALIKRKRPVSA